jgi:quinol monooxygenase YgiN
MQCREAYFQQKVEQRSEAVRENTNLIRGFGLHQQKCVCCLEPDEMIVNTTKIIVHPDKRAEFLQTVHRLTEPIKAAKGCVTCSFYVDAADENSSLLVSEWESEIDLNNYLLSDEFAILRGAINILSSRCTNSKTVVSSRSRTDLREVRTRSI